MRYGIDLGTTNSTICRIENGEPVIKKTDTLKDTLPSCVCFTRKKIIRTGDSAYNNLRQDKAKATKTWDKNDGNVFIEFKRTMGLNTSYYSQNMDRSFSSEELSAEILKSLRSFITDENVDSAVITIPAKFKTDQIAATKRAAKLAGIQHSELLQEPIAASIAYGMTASQKDGNWIVFDFGGGTFDVALLKVEDGIIQVKDTEGDNYLGGKNLDYAIVDRILIPSLQADFCIDEILDDQEKSEILRDALKFYAEQIKNQLSFNQKTDIQSQLDEFGEDDEGEPIELDLEVTREELEGVIKPVFQRAVDITLELMRRNRLTGNDIDSLVLVGGPTYSPVLRKMLLEQVTQNVDSSIDPMTAVAKGAALFAANIESKVEKKLSKGVVELDIDYEANTVQTFSLVTLKTKAGEGSPEEGKKLFVEMVRGDKAWSSGKVEIEEIGALVECQLNEGRSNSFDIFLYDNSGSLVPSYPNQINILQGMVVGDAVLPYFIGVEAHNELTEKDEFVPLKGLEKNQSLPAVGVKNGFKNPKQLRPGNSSDRLIIPIYQGETNSDGTSAKFNDHVFDLVVTGEDIHTLIPENSNIDLTLKVDASQMIHAEIYFSSLGETIDKDIQIKARETVQEEQIEECLHMVENSLNDLKNSSSIPSSELFGATGSINEINNRWNDEVNQEDGRMHLLADVRRVGLKLEEVRKLHEWDSCKEELEKEFSRCEKANDDLGNEYNLEISSYRRQVGQAIRNKDLKAARMLRKELGLLFFKITRFYQLINFIRRNADNFDPSDWKDPQRGRRLLEQGMRMINDSTNESELAPIVLELISICNLEENEIIKI